MKWNKNSKSPHSVLRIFVHSSQPNNDTDYRLSSESLNEIQMSLGIHLVPKTVDASSATWPKMKMSDSGSGDIDVARIIRPQTATLERPRILDVTLLGKIDMSLTRKGLLSISNLCIAPLDNIQTSRDAKRNSTYNRESRHGGKTRKWNTPRISVDDKDRTKQLKNKYKVNHRKTDESCDDEATSVSESSSSHVIRKVSNATTVSRSPSRGTRVKQGRRDKGVSPIDSVSSDANSPRRTFINPAQKEKLLSPASCSNGNPAPTDKRVSPVSIVSSTTNSPSRGSVVKNVPREKRVPHVGSRNSSNVSEDKIEKQSRRTCKRPVVVRKNGENVLEAFGGPKPSDEVPEPCRTCGRPEQPERFHSHPPPTSHRLRSAARRQHDDNNNNSHHQDDASYNNNNNNHRDDATKSVVSKSSVSKPVPMNYRSGKSIRRRSDLTKTAAGKPAPITVSLGARPDAKTAEMQPAGRKSPMNTGRGGGHLVPDDRPPVRPGPRTVLCYLCGREFGTASFPLHEPHCLQRWERENSKLPSHLQRAVPQKPVNPLTVEQWNAFAWEASQAHLVPCENCGRTFNPDRLEVHQRSCRPPPGKVTKRSNQQDEPGDGGGGARFPPAVFCYICGKMFGTRSVGIHEPQCLERWRKENEQLPARQRRAEPVKPQTPTGNITSQEAMDVNWQEHLKTLVPCSQGCGRTFNPDRVAVHERGCKGPKK
ncbi:uncharacterized protein LOC110838834 isoform X2 [Zootermopsis nevadensis]|uniref:uncharacterized protein LOC110838834 isoform X2 n=1 Tax=Zootermopsis nevadensis TaxID=136037 RepID=UPI000B8EA7F6|nr:uncharacterized protein LOC110838834 isoform X2 [Zootermopsis nevadensis]